MRNFANISMPLISLAKKDVAWSWMGVEEQAFCKLKAAITSATCLALIDYADERNELVLYTDTSQVDLGGALVVQDQEHG